jgi:proteic killer suppression protein
MDMLNRAVAREDLQAPPSNRLHGLHDDREGQWAISVSGSWRLCFRFEEGNVYDLELVQYH